MAKRPETAKAELIDRAKEVARDRLPDDRAGEVAELIGRYYAVVPAEDLLERSEADVYGAALAHWHLAGVRQPRTPLIRIYNPEAEQHGWQSTHTIVEIVTDDMPFLVDSVTMELNRHGLGIHLVVHPVLPVRRDAEGRLREIVGEAADEDVVQEAFLHIEVDRQSSQDVVDQVEADLARVLGDLRAAVEDWPAMRERVADVARLVVEQPAPVDPRDLEEAEAFLWWLDDDHFTFLGYREYELTEEDGEDVLRAVGGTGLGILRRDSEEPMSRSFAKLPAPVRRLARQPTLLNLTKANARATVHRPTHLDYVGVKRFGDDGTPVGEWRFLGLYTSAVYHTRVLDVPLLRRKVVRVLERAGFARESHSGKDLLAILETFPRDVLFQISDDELHEISMGILNLQERKRVRLFVRRDTYGRFFTCIVFVPRERYDTHTRRRIEEVLIDGLAGSSVEFTVRLSESVLARLVFTVYTDPANPPDYDVADLEQRVGAATRSWVDELRSALLDRCGEDRGIEWLHRYEQAFPAAYRDEVSARVAVGDIDRIERLSPADALDLTLGRRLEAPDGGLRFRLFRSGSPLSLSDVLPLLEAMGVEVVDQRPYEIRPAGRPPVWIYDFGLTGVDAAQLDGEQARRDFQETFSRAWSGEVENDNFNRLSLLAGIAWRDIVVLRAYAKYLRQVGSRFSQAYMEDSLAANPHIARLLVRYFHARFDPAREDRDDAAAGIHAEIGEALDAVASLDEDRILRSFAALIEATLRTNYFQAAQEAGDLDRLVFKLDPAKVPDAPLPRPMFEIFVYSPRTEGVHLRGGKVARGGLRASDRREDFRTEVLGLMKAQMVKNAVIVPVGAKGGFVVKRPPADGDRERFAEEVVTCYRTFVRGLLDVTDNIAGGTVTGPPRVVRYDDADPYLVVAADKGTATFSDVANEIAAEYDFWLGDAFASGGSSGYDHKKMGITARGAWEAVKRHFLELDMSLDEPFTVVGIGDMSGDVFGNGMLLSRSIKLVGAFNHRHVFLDPDPDCERSYAERERLFRLGASSWADYDKGAISEGGGVYERTAKSIPLSPQVRERLAVDAEALSPNEVISALLRAPVDLLWNGGIGTYVKASDEGHGDVGDKANDWVRVDASDLRCRVIGEGGNLGLTQRARIEYALAGGRCNTDAIDNSAGVDCSDHEVNIKILLNEAVADEDLTKKQRNALLAEMTDEVAALVLRDNYDQNQALSNAAAQAAEMVNVHRRYLRRLEQDGRLNRELERLPDDEAMAERAAADQGLTLPEFAVVLAYTKNTLYDELLGSDVPDDPYLSTELEAYFPTALRERFRERLEQHRLRREIITTCLANTIVNRAGTTFAYRLGEETGASSADLARAYAAAQRICDVEGVWEAVKSLDGKVAAETQTALLLETRRLVERTTRWLLRHRGQPLDIASTIEHFAPGPSALSALLPDVLHGADHGAFGRKVEQWAGEGVPEELANRVAGFKTLFAALDLVEVATSTGESLDDVAKAWFELGARLDMDLLRDRIVALPRDNRWQTLARDALRDDLYSQQAALTARVLDAGNGQQPIEARIESWLERHPRRTERCLGMLADMQARGVFDLAALSVALRELRNLVHAPESPGSPDHEARTLQRR